MLLLLTVAAGLLAFANGANDNFKGVATVYGGGGTRYRTALLWATVTTFAGCLVSLWAAKGLAAAFSGKGLIPDSLLDVRVAGAVALAASSVVLTATALGLPVSTSHAILGSLVGAALALRGWSLPWAALLAQFVLPLATSPVLSAGLAWLMAKFSPEPVCLCSEPVAVPVGRSLAVVGTRVVADRVSVCRAHGASPIVSSAGLSSVLHFASAGTVSFARGMNDAPKLAGLLLVGSIFDSAGWMLAAIALAMALGGILGSARVARTMSKEITPMTAPQGLVANLVTSILVVGASLVSLPDSTTHVSCGAIAGLGVRLRKLAGRRFLQIAVSWMVTLPLA
ncbi:MAG: inorganic phosphate transporter, partial [Acidobacteria bacterium]|nr:inorganic phosphate transporter [Acidobacteriota bacterium]